MKLTKCSRWREGEPWTIQTGPDLETWEWQLNCPRPRCWFFAPSLYIVLLLMLSNPDLTITMLITCQLHCYMISAKIRQPKDPLWLCALDNLMECEVIIIFVRAWSYLSSLCHFIWAILSSTLCHLVIVRTIAMWGVDSWTGGQVDSSDTLSPQMMKTGLFSLHPRPSGLEKLIHNIVMCESSQCAVLCCYCQEPRAAKPVDIYRVFI